MNIPFWKMHGAGNDFVLVDDRELTFPCADDAWLARLGTRRTGVGCDGFLLIQPSDTTADFRMRFFNPDGGEAEMCANGARCIARLAAELGAAPAKMAFDTVAGLVRATVEGEDVLLEMTDPTDWRLERTLVTGDERVAYSFVNTGVPHVVIEVEQIDSCPLKELGPAVRYHEDFAPAGTNVNFLAVTAASELAVRTYERGVENETLACGTGIVAAALIAAVQGRAVSPVRVTAASGDILTVSFDGNGRGVQNVKLRGPTRHVFRGTLLYTGPLAALQLWTRGLESDTYPC